MRAAVLRAAVGRALAVAVLVLAFSEAVVFAARAAGGSSAGVPGVAKAGGLLFFAVHHVGLTVRASSSPGALAGVLPSGSTNFVVAFAPLLATAATLALLAWAGRAVADAGERPAGRGSPWTRGVRGGMVALPYALIAFAGSWLPNLSTRISDSAVTTAPAGVAGTVSGGVSHPGALLWPLGMALVMGFVGGAGARARGGTEAGVDGRVVSPPEEVRGAGFVAAAVRGGGAMLAAVLVLSVVGLLVLAAAEPHATAAYLHGTFGRGLPRGLVLAGLTLLVLPNMAVWVLVPAMGSCVAVSSGASVCVLSYARIPTEPAGFAGGGATSSSSVYLGFLLIPILATVAGGMWAARRANADSRAEATILGAGSGLVFAVLTVMASVLATIAVRTFPTGAWIRVGPDLPITAVAALLWGVVGGSVGGTIGGRSLPSRAPAHSAWEPGPPLATPTDGAPTDPPQAGPTRRPGPEGPGLGETS